MTITMIAGGTAADPWLHASRPSPEGTGAGSGDRGFDAPAPPGRRGPDLSSSKTGFDLLELPVRNEGVVLDHTTVHERLWGCDVGADSTNVAVYVGSLRRTLTSAGAPTLILHTVRGVGYSVRRP